MSRVLLVGMMGSSKSTVGRLLAERTGWPFYDNDALLERATGSTARAILATGGEPALRVEEAAALRLGLALPEPCIVSAAAGTILDEALRVEMGKAIVVWLRANPETLDQRVGGIDARPWRRGDRAIWLEQTLAERAALYASVADKVVDTDERSPEEVAAILEDALCRHR